MSSLRPLVRPFAAVCLAAATACGGSTAADKVGPPATITPVGALTPGVVGSVVATPATFKVTDAKGRAVPGARVSFSVTAGNGTVNPGVDTTDTDGQASTQLTLGTTAGANEVTAAINLVAASGKLSVNGTPDVVAAVSMSTHALRFQVGTDTMRIVVQVRDRFGNTATPAATFTPRDQSLVSVDAAGLVRALRRGGATYVVALSGSVGDSALVTVLAPGDPPCAGGATAVTLAVGQVVDAPSDLCIQAGSANEEYVMMPFFSSQTASAVTQVKITGNGLGVAPSSNVSASRYFAGADARLAGPVRDDAFDLALRTRERELAAAYAPAARAWWKTRRSSNELLRSTAAAPPNVGDIVSLNTSLTSCSSPTPKFGRIAAITQKAIIVSDTTNPSGGFTDAEYNSFGVTFDTLIAAVDTAAFGAPTDIDANGKVIIFFTRAVNEMTSQGSQAITLGFFYSRDLFPTTSCLGSNVAEMFYLIVPDPTGVVNGNTRTKAFVLNTTPPTIAHEFQHLINGSRRLYVNASAQTNEEVWLNEGLSHIAEELVFYRVSHFVSRLNIGSAAFSDPTVFAVWQTYMQQNYLRYRTYLPVTESNSPFSGSGSSLQNRGAVWSYLRYSADRLLPDDGDVWFRLVNAQSTGFTNVSTTLGTDAQVLMRDWAMSVYLDDNVPGIAAAYKQASWNTRAEATALGQSFPVVTSGLADGVASTVALGAGGVSFRRFSVAAGQVALFSLTAQDGSPLPSTVKISVARTK